MSAKMQTTKKLAGEGIALSSTVKNGNGSLSSGPSGGEVDVVKSPFPAGGQKGGAVKDVTDQQINRKDLQPIVGSFAKPITLR